MFSGFYLVLVLILVLLIVRVLSFEWRERADDRRWLGGWRWANTIASFGAPFLWGVALANLLHGVPLDGDGDFSGNVLDLFNAYTVAAGVAVTLLFALHGATFLALRTEGGLRERSRAAAPPPGGSRRARRRRVPRLDRPGGGRPQRPRARPGARSRR